MSEQPDLFGARAARDEAMERVEDHAGINWNRRVHRMVIGLPIGWQGTSEDMRLRFVRAGLSEPHHHNAWGPVTLWAVKVGLFVEVGRENMKTTKSHARNTPIYLRRRPQ
jgi:hypothetical protein